MRIPEEIIQALATEHSFLFAGATPLDKSPHAEQYERYIAEGRHANMTWMKTGAAPRIRPDEHHKEHITAIMFGMPYFSSNLPDDVIRDPSRGIIARYAWSRDYHRVLEKRLEKLQAALQTEYPNIPIKRYVGTGPIMEKEWAEKTGIGFIGKNTLLINQNIGSYLFLATILIGAEIGQPQLRNTYGQCGACTKCQIACPTGALVAPYTMDARKCIAYLTVEHRGVIDPSFYPLMGNRIFGCDICQEACPWNLKARMQNDPDFAPREQQQAPKLLDLITLTEEQFKNRYQGTPIMRAKHEGFLRNVMIAIGNWDRKVAQENLTPFLKHKSEILKETAKYILG